MTCFSRGLPARRRRGLVAGIVLPAALLVPFAACSSSDAPDGTAVAPVPTAALEAARAGGPPAVENATDLTRKPVAAAGKGAAPSELVVKDLVTGDGATASDTSTVTIQYVGTIWKSGKQFDASWDRGEPDTFPLLRTVTGFGQGISGMKEGGRRLIVIPPDLGYGPMGGQPPTILADDSLVFVVDLLSVAADGSGSGQPEGGGSAGTGDSTAGAL
ncbi:peptidylprolyl isomerase [Frankia sp. EI5c]|uniref:FKBP-type peptidyl-prolyl cis-trans isomerase n=1 Tax=Frankia sp. EI5c TaxID=683316 RepID=UPI0007C400ED|nr:FKBP-type peptidyl-prolyl cis-trans isomerase [Frankia sp. EI5c]OAA28504.1 peptidylprolyl isomerase [Frankia sp. EI5c]